MKLAPSPAGAYRNASMTQGGGTSTQIVLDTLDPGYPYTRLSSGTLTLEAAGPVTITAQITFFSSSSGTAALHKNGTSVATGNNAATSTLTYSYTAAAGDQITLWETDNFAGVSLVTGQTATFVHVVPAGAANFTGLPVPQQRASLH